MATVRENTSLCVLTFQGERTNHEIGKDVKADIHVKGDWGNNDHADVHDSAAAQDSIPEQPGDTNDIAAIMRTPRS